MIFRRRISRKQIFIEELCVCNSALLILNFLEPGEINFEDEATSFYGSCLYSNVVCCV